VKLSTDTLYITRFFAAVGVVFYHYKPVDLSKDVVNEIITNLDEGVNYFYFLSGFVMIMAYQKPLFTKGSIDKISYWIKRIARIYPLYLVALLLCLVFHFGIRSQFTSLVLRMPFELLMVQTWFYNGSINYPAWSISCEAFFYLLFPFIVPHLISFSTRKLIATAVVCLGINLLVQLGGNEIEFVQSHKFIHSLMATQPVFRTIIFVCGMLAALLLIKGSVPFIGRFTVVIGLLGLLFIILLTLYELSPGSLWLRAGILVPLYSVFVVLLCSLQGDVSRFLSNPFFILLGDSSYGIYILQFPVHLFFTYFITETGTLPGLCSYLAVLILISILSHQFFEKPVREYANTRFLKSRVSL